MILGKKKSSDFLEGSIDSRITRKMEIDRLPQDEYPMWLTKERVMGFIYSLPKDAWWNALFCVYVLAVVEIRSGIQLDPPPPPEPADLLVFINLMLLDIPYVFRVFTLICNDYHSIKLGESRSLYQCGYILDMISLVLPYIVVAVFGIRRETRLILLAFYTLRMHRPFKYLGSLNYYLIGSIIGTLCKYIYTSVAMRVFYAFVFVCTKQTKDLEYEDYNEFFNNTERRLMLRSFYEINKIFIPLGPDYYSRDSLSRLLYIVVMLSGVLLVTGVAIASLSLIIGLYMRPEEEFRSRFRLIMDDMKKTNLPKELCNKVKTFYRMFWDKQKAVSETRLLPIFPHCLSIAIRTNIYFHAMQKSQLIRDLSSHLLSEIAQRMETVHYIPGDFIITRNSGKSAMIFINNGDVELLSAEDDETALLRFTRGTILNPCAACAAIACTRSYVAIGAATFCTAHVLNTNDFWLVIAKYGLREQSYIIRFAISQHLGRVKRHFAQRVRCNFKYLSNIVSLKRALISLKEARDENGELLLESTNMLINISGCYLMRNREDLSSTGDSDEICLQPTFPCILQPESSLLLAWNLLVAVLTLIVAFVHPYYLVYLKDVSTEFQFFNFMVTFVYILDLIVFLSTGTKVEEGVPLTFMHTSSEQMMSYWCVINVISVLPIFELIDGGYYSGINKLAKIPQIFRTLKSLEDHCVYHSNVLRFFSLLLLIIILTYLVGALQQFFTCISFGYCLLTNLTHPPYWEKKPLDNGPVDGRLSFSLYYAISMITFTSHKTAILARTLWRYQFFVIMIMEVCAILRILIEATYSATIMVSETQRERYKTCIETVKTFLVKINMDPVLRHRFINYLQLCWYTDKAYAITHNQNSILYDLPSHVNEDILTRQRSKYFLRIPFMKSLPTDVLKKISAQTRLFYTAPNEVLLNTGDIINEIYVIKEGFCEVIDPETNVVVRILSARGYFGDVECLLRLPAYFSVRAATHVHLFSISKRLLENIIASPKIQDAINYTKELPEYEALLTARESFLNFEGLPKPPSRAYFPLLRKQESDHAFLHPFYKFGYLSILRYVLPRYTFRPDGRYLKRCEWFRTACAILSANIFPFYTILQLQWPWLWHLTMALDICAYINIMQRCLVGYFDKNGILIYHPLSTLTHYLKGAFLVDVLACVPLEYLDYVRTTIYFKDNAYRIPTSYSLLMCNRVLQLYRVPNTLDILDDFIDRQDIILILIPTIPPVVRAVVWWIRRATRRVTKILIIIYSLSSAHICPHRANMLKLIRIKAIPFLMALISLVTTLMLEYSITKWNPVGGGWRIEILRDAEHGSWIENNKKAVWFNITETPWNTVLTTFYWVVYETTSTGFNIFQPHVLNIVNLLTAGMLLGLVITTYYAVRVISIRSNVDQALGRYQEHMKDIITFMKKEKLCKNLQSVVVSHYEYQWEKTGGTDSFSILKLCNQITLRTDAILHIYGKTFTKCPIIPIKDISLLRNVGRAVKSAYMPANMTIVEQDDVISEMYVVDRGFVEMHDALGTNIVYLPHGSVFGNLDNLDTVVCPSKFVTGSNVHLLKIRADKFHIIIKDFPAAKTLLSEYRPNDENYIVSDKKFEPYSSSNKFRRSNSLVSTKKERILHFFKDHKKQIQLYTMSICLLSLYGDLYNASFQDNRILLIASLYILDVCFLLTILLTLLIPYLVTKGTERRNELVAYRHEYIHNDFKWDLMSCLPIEILCLISSLPSTAFAFLRLNRCFRLIALYKNVTKYHKNLTINLTVTTVATVATWFILFVHTMTCIWNYLGIIEDNRQLFSSWRYKVKGVNKTICQDPYICAMYFIITTFTQNGVGDILPRNQSEIIFVCILMILSTIICMIFVGEFSNIIQYRSFRYYAFYSKYLELLAFLKNNRVSPTLINVTKHYTLHLWQEARGRQVPHFLNTAPKCLRLNIMSAAYMHHLTSHPLLSRCEPSFLRQLVGHFKLFHYSEDLFVVKEGQITNSMYFIHKGIVTEFDEHFRIERKIYKAREYFGSENGLNFDIPYDISYKTIIKSQVLTLCFDEWQYLLNHFSESKCIIDNDRQRRSDQYFSLRKHLQIDKKLNIRIIPSDSQEQFPTNKRSLDSTDNLAQFKFRESYSVPMESKHSTGVGSTVPEALIDSPEITEKDNFVTKPVKPESLPDMTTEEGTSKLNETSTPRNQTSKIIDESIVAIKRSTAAGSTVLNDKIDNITPTIEEDNTIPTEKIPKTEELDMSNWPKRHSAYSGTKKKTSSVSNYDHITRSTEQKRYKSIIASSSSHTDKRILSNQNKDIQSLDLGPTNPDKKKLEINDETTTKPTEYLSKKIPFTEKQDQVTSHAQSIGVKINEPPLLEENGISSIPQSLENQVVSTDINNQLDKTPGNKPDIAKVPEKMPIMSIGVAYQKEIISPESVTKVKTNNMQDRVNMVSNVQPRRSKGSTNLKDLITSVNLNEIKTQAESLATDNRQDRVDSMPEIKPVRTKGSTNVLEVPSPSSLNIVKTQAEFLNIDKKLHEILSLSEMQPSTSKGSKNLKQLESPESLTLTKTQAEFLGTDKKQRDVFSFPEMQPSTSKDSKNLKQLKSLESFNPVKSQAELYADNNSKDNRQDNVFSLSDMKPSTSEAFKYPKKLEILESLFPAKTHAESATTTSNPTDETNATSVPLILSPNATEEQKPYTKEASLETTESESPSSPADKKKKESKK